MPFRFVGYDQIPDLAGCVTFEEVEIKPYSYSYATPREHEPNYLFRGCLYDNEGRLIRNSQRWSARAAYIPTDPEHIVFDENADFIPGRSLYLGIYHDVFSHFILKSICNSWALKSISSEFDNFIFHAWRSEFTDTSWDIAKGSYEAMGIDLSRVKIISTRPAIIENCWVPSGLYKINHCCHFLMNSVYNNIINHANSINRPIDTPDKIYLSRKYQGRHAINEETLEEIFRAEGYNIIYPEQYRFIDQVQLASNASTIAGCDGSNMHLACFANKKTTVFNIDCRIVINQYVIESLRELDAHHVWCLQKPIDDLRWQADEQAVLENLRYLADR